MSTHPLADLRAALAAAATDEQVADAFSRHGLALIFPPSTPRNEPERAALAEVGRLCAEAMERARLAGQPGVLVVDDEEAVRTVLEIALRLSGLEVRLAASGEEAVELYRRDGGSIGVVLLDVRMPGLDGPQTLAALREIDPDLACCFMSGDAGRYSTEDLLAMGTAHFFAKPFVLADLVRVLREVAARARPSRRSGSGGTARGGSVPAGP
jgi:CheY-like chemotaxis protein